MLQSGARAKLMVCLIGVAGASLAACATPKPPPAKPRAAAPAPPKRLAWLPVDPLDAPDVAPTINEHLSRLKIAGTGETVRGAVSLEVAQLAIECTDATPTCYTAVGRSLGVDQLLWAELRRSGTPKPSIRVALALFDVRAGAPPKRIERTFDGTEEARAGVAELVAGAFTPTGATP
jgi:hypothetical protein